MKQFRFYWKDGKIDTGLGKDVSDAFANLYDFYWLQSVGWFKNLDHYEEIEL